MSATDFGEPMFKGLTYCVRCCMPESNEGIKFDEMGICQACQSAEQKIHIDWTERERELRKLLDHHKSLNNDYDCLVPISGGKDSTFQLHVITKIYGMRPLAVTFSHNWFSETGKYNLQNAIEKFNVDHIMFTPNRALVNKLARESLLSDRGCMLALPFRGGSLPIAGSRKIQDPLIDLG